VKTLTVCITSALIVVALVVGAAAGRGVLCPATPSPPIATFTPAPTREEPTETVLVKPTSTPGPVTSYHLPVILGPDVDLW
jgi:hypothetical protein